MDSSELLVLKNPDYKKSVELYVWQAYLNDFSGGDITTKFFVPDKGRIVEANIIAKESGVLAGIQEAEWFLHKIGIEFEISKKDGDKIESGNKIIVLNGRADNILACERTLLNLLQRMSGVATATYKLSNKLPNFIKLLATRKTLWGDLDKRAVSIGGGCTHRLNLGDAILIKENHIFLSSELPNILKDYDCKFIEIELENFDQVKKFAENHENKINNSKVVVMLDNFTPENVKRAIKILSKIKVIIEISGGIDENNIENYVIEGVSAISSGSITNKAPAFDFSLLIVK